MKKRIVSLFLVAAMAMGLMAGCGATTEETTPTTTPSTDGGNTTTADAEGKVLNIYCWNDEFQSRVKDHYPDYETTSDPNVGQIGDVKVVWTIVPNENNGYQNNLDAALLKQADAADDDKVDIFLIEADYALKYVDADASMPIADLGIADSELGNQYKYTKDIVTDSNGVLKGVSWQACPGVLFYNRKIAKEVLGADDADTVQAAVKDWATFAKTAEDVKKAGYLMTASVNDAFRVYSNNVKTPWVVDDKIVIDDNIKAWVDMSKAMVDAKQTSTEGLWSDAWNAGMMDATPVFCYFGPAWLINFCMHADDAASVAGQGGYGAVVGPQSFYWGGTWICAAAGSDNKTVIADIIRKLTTDEEIMKGIVTKDDDFVNNQPAMEAMAKDESYSSAVLGGINPLQMYCDGVKTIDLSNLSKYDQACNEEFQNAMKQYFDGKASYDEALDLFYKAVEEKHSNLTH